MKYAPKRVEPLHWLLGRMVPWVIYVDGVKLEKENPDPMRRACTWADAEAGAVEIIPYYDDGGFREIETEDGWDVETVVIDADVEIEPREVSEYMAAALSFVRHLYRKHMYWPIRHRTTRARLSVARWIAR